MKKLPPHKKLNSTLFKFFFPNKWQRIKNEYDGKNILEEEKFLSGKQIALIVVILYLSGFLMFISYARNNDNTSFESYYVSRVIDGDTIEIQDDYSKRTVRLAGIDTPESVHPRKPVECFGIESSVILKNLIEGEYVKIDFQGKGKYNRDIGYVYADGKSVNELMIKTGSAFHYDKYPHKYEKKYKKLEKKAKRKNRGLWEHCY